ncbi:MAG: hypothetical protein K5905_20995 [Roseibium sp.]|uniref:CbiX/SirB N-terminal domain-containing protein n=1 Tax=Roseibium sp. TaxID=1936156 RepID=UPI00261E8C70|nr:CbiX/SirB N-terminal domain-containing protein [Roseibium sp.]MCV0427942.1 hypothetical protein [Roseibium sp.]
MSGTRSRFRRGPVTEAVIVSHGQPSKPQAGEDHVRELANQVARRLPDWSVRAATLATPGALERVLSSCQNEPLIFPVFMAEGWFTRKALPDRLGNSSCRQLAPLGALQELPRSALRLLSRAAERRNWSLDECEILIAAHGSATGNAAAESCENFVAAMKEILPASHIRIGYLEQDPDLASVAAECGPKTLALPFFATPGGHVKEDVPQALKRAEFQGVQLPCLGQAWFIPELIAQSLKLADNRSLAA